MIIGKSFFAIIGVLLMVFGAWGWSLLFTAPKSTEKPSAFDWVFVFALLIAIPVFGFVILLASLERFA